MPTLQQLNLISATFARKQALWPKKGGLASRVHYICCVFSYKNQCVRYDKFASLKHAPVMGVEYFLDCIRVIPRYKTFNQV